MFITNTGNKVYTNRQEESWLPNRACDFHVIVCLREAR